MGSGRAQFGSSCLDSRRPGLVTDSNQPSKPRFGDEPLQAVGGVLDALSFRLLLLGPHAVVGCLIGDSMKALALMTHRYGLAIQ